MGDEQANAEEDLSKMLVWLLILTFAGVDFEGGQYQERAWCVHAAKYQVHHQKPLVMRWRCELRTL